MHRSLTPTLATVILLFATPSLANDEEFCDGVIDSKIDADLIVPDGAVCRLDGAKIDGDVEVEPGGALAAVDSKIDGNVESDGAAWIAIGPGTKVDGNLYIEGTTSTPEPDVPNFVCDSKIDGNLVARENTAPLDIGCDEGNKIDGNVELWDNASDTGGFEVRDNKIDGNLLCSGNDPAPTGGGNKVDGSAEDQCADLAVTNGKGNGNGNGKKKGEDIACDGTVGNEKVGDVTVVDGAVCTLEDTRVSGDVTVEPGGALMTIGARIAGNLESEGAEAIELGKNTRVRGNVLIEGTTGTPDGSPNQVCEAKIKGNLVVQGNAAPFDLGCEKGNKVAGNVEILENEVSEPFDGVVLGLYTNKVKGNLVVEDNASTTGTIEVKGSKVKGNLEVVDNFIGGTVSGDVIDVDDNKVKGNLLFDDNTSTEGSFDLSENKVKGNLECADNDPAPGGSDNKIRGNREGQCADL